MKLSTSLVAVKKINCNTPRSNFTEEELEKAASVILELGGTISPIILKRTSLQSYEVVEGDFVYHAAARAREIDPKKGEMVGVYIIDDENKASISKQIEIFRQQNQINEKPVNLTQESLQSFLNNLEARIDKLAKQLLTENKEKYQLELENKELKSKLDRKILPLDIFNNFEEDRLALKLNQAGINDGDAQKIAKAIVKERKRKRFTSLSDIIERTKAENSKKPKKAISKDRMFKVVDKWLLFEE